MSGLAQDVDQRLDELSRLLDLEFQLEALAKELNDPKTPRSEWPRIERQIRAVVAQICEIKKKRMKGMNAMGCTGNCTCGRLG